MDEKLIKMQKRRDTIFIAFENGNVSKVEHRSDKKLIAQVNLLEIRRERIKEKRQGEVEHFFSHKR